MMRCEDVLETLAAYRGDQDAVEYRRAEKHLQQCEWCRHAAHAVNALHDERREPVPAPEHGAFARAVRAAVEPRPRIAAARRHFWAGAAAGGALAAGIAVAVALVWPLAQAPESPRAPTVTAALNEVHAVELELASPRPLENAEIRLVLDGAIELDGYDGARELTWSTDLDAGTNRLSLPVIVRGQDGGRIRVVVRTGERTRSFRVDVRAGGSTAPVGQLDGTIARPSRV